VISSAVAAAAAAVAELAEEVVVKAIDWPS